jgi:hypothetical protein
MSCIAAASPGLNDRIVTAIDAGIRNLDAKFGKGG